ncbi:hypothetical protein ACNI3K_02195 [Demequina sp. SO4-13]|uniref:hypothetical protein n=1 Tax=Demequina sp. SO4-13 TaxID=3401027 RepID=UPI003AF91579
MKNDPPLAHSHAPTRVLVSQRLMSPSVGYVDQIVGEDQNDVIFEAFSGLPRATDVDVVHLHRLSALGGARARSGKKRVAVALAFAARIRSNGIALVRTWHGADANDAGGRSARLANWILNRVTTEFVIVDPSTKVPNGASGTLIPYGHYRERFVGYPRSPQVPGRLLCIAAHLHTSVERFVRDYVEGDVRETTLRVVGSAGPARAARLREFAETGKDSVSTRIERVSDGAMVMEISASELVVLPNAGELDDLHMVFLALSLDRPVLVPDSPLMRSVADSVGAEWVHRSTAPLDPAVAAEVLSSVRTDTPPDGPSLDGRDREATSAMYADVFRAAAKKTSRR